jgi:hypothetical protein
MRSVPAGAVPAGPASGREKRSREGSSAAPDSDASSNSRAAQRALGRRRTIGATIAQGMETRHRAAEGRGAPAGAAAKNLKRGMRRAILERIQRERKDPRQTMEDRRRRKKDHDVTGEFCERFGAIAVHKGFATLDQVKKAIGEQIDDDVHGREHRLVGTILYQRGWITEEQIEQVLLELRKTFA